MLGRCLEEFGEVEGCVEVCRGVDKAFGGFERCLEVLRVGFEVFGGVEGCFYLS